MPIFQEALLLHYLDDMDSKMECMRALIEKEPKTEGYFTAYSAPLERVALRKARYLESNPTAVAPVADADNAFAEPDLPELVSTLPGRSPAPAPPNLKSTPPANSIFGAKLQQALHDERK